MNTNDPSRKYFTKMIQSFLTFFPGNGEEEGKLNEQYFFLL